MSDETKEYKGRGNFISMGRPRDREPLRRPGEGTSNKDSDPNLVNNLKSILSPMAAEFVPRSSAPPTEPPAPSETFQPVENGEPEDLSVSHVRTIMYEITVNPGKFDTLARLLVDALNVTVTSEATMKSVVHEIVEQAVTEPNFRYNGARLCKYLDNNLKVSFNNVGFRSNLFRRLEQDYKLKDSYVQDPDQVERLRGFTMFMGELFVHFEIMMDRLSHKVTLLGEIVPLLLETLLKHPTSENIKCVCQMLKFTGAALEDHERLVSASAKTMDKLFSLMKSLTLGEAVDRRSKEMLINVIELRASDWGRVPSSPVVRDEAAGEPDAFGTQPILYGPDGNPISSEEVLFLESNQYLYENVSNEEECDEIEYYRCENFHTYIVK